jgi:uncharacterized Zn finger protein (UPF0148 family)
MKNQRCCAEVFQSYGMQRYPCPNKAKVERDGKHYCGVHDPVRLAEKAAIREAKAEAEREESSARWRAQTERTARAFMALGLLEDAYQSNPISNLERLIAADKEAGE